MDDNEAAMAEGGTVWAVFGDLMAGLLGAFVLILAAVLGLQLELATNLQSEVQKRQTEEQRREVLERALPSSTPNVSFERFPRLGVNEINKLEAKIRILCSGTQDKQGCWHATG